MGQSVALKACAYPNDVFLGNVTFIATSVQGSSNSAERNLFDTASPTSRTGPRNTILVTTQIENQGLLLKPEMTGQAKISAAKDGWWI